MPLLRFFLALLLLLPLGALYAQNRPATAPRPAGPGPQPVKGTPVELLPGTGELRGGDYNGVKIRKLLGNVSFRQQDVLLYCDSAYQYLERNEIEAFSNVRIVQSDTMTITGDHGFYDGNKRTARMTGKQVVMHDPRMTLTTTALDYDLNRKTAFYTVGGHLVDPKNTLDSQQGFYDTNSKVFVFKRDVHLVSLDETGQPTDLRNDTLTFNTISKIAYFNGPTRIKSAQGDLYAEKGTYNTVTRISNFAEKAQIETPGYLLGGDVLVYDQVKLYGVATGHVSLISKKDNLVLRGEQGRYWRALGRTKLFGARPVMRNISGKDTLYMAADTLLSVEARPNRAVQRPILYAWPKVQIFRGKMQGRCDSLTYDRQDSIIYLNRDPVVWQAHNQLTSDSMNLRFKHGQLDRANLFSNAFAIQEDTVQNYNQVKGRNMIAYFQRGQMARIDVLGNAESLYFTLDGDTVLSGMNKSVSATMTLRFVDNKIKQLTWLTNPEASYIPVHELLAENKELKAFRWRPAERPTRRQVFGKHFASDLKQAKPKPKAKTKTKTKAKVRSKAKPATPPAKPATPTAAPRPPVTAVPAAVRPATAATPR
ncbi:OstA-like protein [Hymenobacter sp. H14-R3]|uniref:OstA-like protein n=1 Tax=Hymenobacter sp. H14-R3 TaxID=3046308 RepID=UPI0024B8AA47|nr:OstA-like protein [Hymenobacter sp. H14-R3]MDJ0365445.1 OstA-like protein [Hymenobacter sp. H14-R3]